MLQHTQTMIVCGAAPDRVANYQHVREHFPHLHRFDAVDTRARKDFDRHAARGLADNIVTPEFIRKVISEGRLGGLGLFLSCYDICVQAPPGPVLCLEDDVVLLYRGEQKLAELLTHLPAGWDYVLLEHRGKPSNQYAEEHRVDRYYFRLQPQFGAAAGLFSKHGREKFLRSLPATEMGDNHLNNVILSQGNWEALIPDPVYMPFRTGGTICGRRTPDSQFGSLLWGVK